MEKSWPKSQANTLSWSISIFANKYVSDPLEERRHSWQYIKFNTILLLFHICECSACWEREKAEANVVNKHKAARQLVPVLGKRATLKHIRRRPSKRLHSACVCVCLGLGLLMCREAHSQNFILCVGAARRGAGDINFAAAAPSRLTISWPAEFTALKLRRAALSERCFCTTSSFAPSWWMEATFLCTRNLLWMGESLVIF